MTESRGRSIMTSEKCSFCRQPLPLVVGDIIVLKIIPISLILASILLGIVLIQNFGYRPPLPPTLTKWEGSGRSIAVLQYIHEISGDFT